MVATFTFPTAFSTIPQIIVTAVNDGTFTDKFSVSITSLTTTSVSFVVVRLGVPTPNAVSQGWGQNLKLNWWAFE